jgi:hypothetical protein
VFTRGQGFLLEPVCQSKGAAWFEQFASVEKEAGNVLIVRDGFDRPEHVEEFVEVHGFGVHAEESGSDSGLSSGFIGHFDLDR